jgi:hypothetical protein
LTDSFLHRYALTNADKPLFKWIHYLEIYERHLERFRGASPTLIEIGVLGGGSLQMWRAYLGSDARIVGVDIDPRCKAHESDGVEVFIGDQSDPGLLQAIVDKYGAIDIVIDDGSHNRRDQIATFEHLYPRQSARGVYLVEDCHAKYPKRRRTGPVSDPHFVEYAKDRIDELYASYGLGAPMSEFTRTTAAIVFYDSIVAFERAPQGRRQPIKTERMSLKTAYWADLLDPAGAAAKQDDAAKETQS